MAEEESKYQPSSNPPLTWREARYRLRSFLAQYAAETPTTSVKKREGGQEIKFNGKFPRVIGYWLGWDLDVYIGAFGSSLIILILSSRAYKQDALAASDDTGELDDINLRLQFAGGILLFLGSLINLWLIYRRRHSNQQGSDSLKRREISRFLRELEKQEEERLTRQDNADDIDIQEHPLELAGTSLAGVYPVYRRKYRHGAKSEAGSWCRIPTLLLVKGDHIALQIGDISPASCKLIEGHRVPVQLEAGEVISLDTFQETSTLTSGKWPRGRTTLPKESDKLLALCNSMRIFEVTETPLEPFLKHPRGRFDNCRVLLAF